MKHSNRKQFRMSLLSIENPTPCNPSLHAQRNKSTIDSTILSPGAVKINFQGAFIVDEESQVIGKEDGAQHDTKGIRLPNHKAVVSHVALDASPPEACSSSSCCD